MRSLDNSPGNQNNSRKTMLQLDFKFYIAFFIKISDRNPEEFKSIFRCTAILNSGSNLI